MAERVNEANYEAMITALGNFAKNISSLADEMKSLSDTCISALSNTDKAIGPISAKTNACVRKYYTAASMALKIAKAMREELEEQQKEDQVWGSDD